MINEWFEFEETRKLVEELNKIKEEYKEKLANGDYYGSGEPKYLSGICTGIQSVLDYVESRKDM
jgi:hypothetical protein